MQAACVAATVAVACGTLLRRRRCRSTATYTSTIDVTDGAATAAATAATGLDEAGLESERETIARLSRRLAEAEAAVATAVKFRAEERAGRIAAQRSLQEAVVEARSAAGGAYGFTPIGVMESCFSNRCGTPRQSGIAPAVRGRIKMAAHVPAAAFEDLEAYSHGTCLPPAAVVVCAPP